MSGFDGEAGPETVSRIAALLLDYADPENGGDELVDLLEQAACLDVEVTVVVAAGLLRSVVHGIAGQFGRPAAADVLRQLAATSMAVSNPGSDA